MSPQLDFHQALEHRCKRANAAATVTMLSLTLLALAYITVFAASMASPAWRMSWPHFTYLMGLHALALISFLLMEKTE